LNIIPYTLIDWYQCFTGTGCLNLDGKTVIQAGKSGAWYRRWRDEWDGVMTKPIRISNL
jgi:hypothetical protein